MSAQGRFLELPSGYDPLAPRTVATSAFPSKRLIVVLRSDEKSDRYALHRFPDGTVSWRADTFTSPEDPAVPEEWIAYRGELSVAEVIELVPDQRRAVIGWTRDEIARGVEVVEGDEPVALERRERSLIRLRAELDALQPGESRAA